MKSFELVSFAGADELARAAATAWLDEVAAADRAGERHCVALSGGRIARNFFAAVVNLAAARAVSFNCVHFFWADERCVPPADEESNFRLANELLFEPLNISGSRIHRVRGEDTPETAVKSAAEEICRVAVLDGAGQPMLDLILLGLGEDGHVASLFPGEPDALVRAPDVYRAVRTSPKPPPNRITLGYRAIAAARQVWMLASGAGKERALRESLAFGGTTPFGRVIELRRHTRILSDIVVEKGLPGKKMVP